MMRKRTVIALGLIILSPFTVSACQPEPSIEAGATGDILSETELEHKKKRALQGDGGAAYDVAIHYEVYPGSEAEAEAMKWLTIAANLNHIPATEHLIWILMERGDGGKDCELGKAWLRRLDQRITNPRRRKALHIDERLSKHCEAA